MIVVSQEQHDFLPPFFQFHTLVAIFLSKFFRRCFTALAFTIPMLYLSPSKFYVLVEFKIIPPHLPIHLLLAFPIPYSFLSASVLLSSIPNFSATKTEIFMWLHDLPKSPDWADWPVCYFPLLKSTFLAGTSSPKTKWWVPSSSPLSSSFEFYQFNITKIQIMQTTESFFGLISRTK